MRARGLLLNWFDIEPGKEAAFDAWHNREHVIERVGIPGFRRGRRFESIDVPPAKGHGYLIAYDADDVGVFESVEYGRRLDNPTGWTRATVPFLRHVTRTAYEIAARQGAGSGGFLRTIRFKPGASLDASVIADGLADIAADDALTSVLFGRPDTKATHFKDKTQEGAQTETLSRADYPWAVIVEACRREGLDAATRSLDQLVSRHLPGTALDCHSYQLVFALGKGGG